MSGGRECLHSYYIVISGGVTVLTDTKTEHPVICKYHSTMLTHMILSQALNLKCEVNTKISHSPNPI